MAQNGYHISEDIKTRAIEAWSASGRMSMLRVGDPWMPIAQAIAKAEHEHEAVELLRAICNAASLNHDKKPWPQKYAAPYREIAEAMEWLSKLKSI